MTYSLLSLSCSERLRLNEWSLRDAFLWLIDHTRAEQKWYNDLSNYKITVPRMFHGAAKMMNCHGLHMTVWRRLDTVKSTTDGLRFEGGGEAKTDPSWYYSFLTWISIFCLQRNVFLDSLGLSQPCRLPSTGLLKLEYTPKPRIFWAFVTSIMATPLSWAHVLLLSLNPNCNTVRHAIRKTLKYKILKCGVRKTLLDLRLWQTSADRPVLPGALIACTFIVAPLFLPNNVRIRWGFMWVYVDIRSMRRN